MSKTTIVEELEKHESKAGLAKLATQLLTDAGLPVPNPLGTKPQEILNRVNSQVPAAAWVGVGEKAGKEIESRLVTKGRWTTKVNVLFDRTRNIVAEGHTRGDESDYDHSAWVDFKLHATAAKAEAAWAKLLKKYRLATESDPVVPTKPVVQHAPTTANERALQESFWENPDDTSVLQVLADHWLEKGDSRGELVQLSLLENPTEAQKAKRGSLLASQKGKLVGPAREFLTEFHFGANGLIERAGTDAERYVAGREAIESLNPRLALTISTRKLAAVKELASASLERIHFLTLTTQLNDKKLELLAPALANIRNLSLGCRGKVGEIITPAGLRVLGDHMKQLEYLQLDYYCEPHELPAYLETIASHPGFRTLKVVTVDGSEDEIAILKKLPQLVQTITPHYVSDGPSTAADLELVKKGGQLKPRRG